MEYSRLDRLYKYVQENDYTGYDPFDGLNAAMFKSPVLGESEFLKLFWIQLNKVSPVNIRPFFSVPKGFNAKGGALFLSGLLNIYSATGEDKYLSEIEDLYSRILSRKIKTSAGIGFGYNFDWKARAFSASRNLPNMVTTAYVGRAFMSYQQAINLDIRTEIDRIKDFFMSDMIGLEDEVRLCFYYVPGEETWVHNANLLAAAFLSEYAKLYGRDLYPDIKEKVEKAVRFSIEDINPDFSWPYGKKTFHRWVDNFHTAFNVEALLTVSEVFPDIEIDHILDGVLRYYFKELFADDGTPKYYSNKLFPIDIHVLAETKILMNRLSSKEERFGIDPDRKAQITKKNDEWIDKFQSKEGYYYYRRNRYYWNKIPYMRWAQAWMFYALSTDLNVK